MKPGTRGEWVSSWRPKSPAAGGWIEFRAVHGHRSVCAGPRLLQRGCAQARTGRRFHDGAGNFAAVRRVRRAAMRRRCWRDDRWDRYWRSARAAAAWRWMYCRGSKRSKHCPSAIGSSRSARICATGSAARSSGQVRICWRASSGSRRRRRGAFDGVILANEVLDALPVARFRWHRHAAARNSASQSKRAACVWAPRPASATTMARAATRSRRRGADGRTATCRSIVRGSRRGPRK